MGCEKLKKDVLEAGFLKNLPFFIDSISLENRPMMPHMIEKLFSSSSEVILGKEHQVRLAFCCLLARGHLLVEDVPGVGKTTLVKFFAKALDLKSSRIQFTNDLLPADILGTSIFNEALGEFRFYPGPIFGQIVVADELNRATPKTQSACLQAMEERKVTVDGVTHDLPQPFFLIATQNPMEQSGTFPLPESQLDRFLMRIDLGYPDREAEKQLLKGESRNLLLDRMSAVMSADELQNLQEQVHQVLVADPVIDYIQDILAASRNYAVDCVGLSPRAGLALLKSSQAWAFIHQRSYVLPEDVQAVALSVMAHRLNHFHRFGGEPGATIAANILNSVPVDK